MSEVLSSAKRISPLKGMEDAGQVGFACGVALALLATLCCPAQITHHASIRRTNREQLMDV